MPKSAVTAVTEVFDKDRQRKKYDKPTAQQLAIARIACEKSAKEFRRMLNCVSSFHSLGQERALRARAMTPSGGQPPSSAPVGEITSDHNSAQVLQVPARRNSHTSLYVKHKRSSDVARSTTTTNGDDQDLMIPELRRTAMLLPEFVRKMGPLSVDVSFAILRLLLTMKGTNIWKRWLSSISCSCIGISRFVNIEPIID